MAPLCKFVKGGAVRANDLPLSNDLEAWPDSSVGRVLNVQCQGSRVRIPLGSVIFTHFYFHFFQILLPSQDINSINFTYCNVISSCKIIERYTPIYTADSHYSCTVF